MLPIVLVLLDGLGDRAHDVLGGLTAAEAAAVLAQRRDEINWPLGSSYL